MEFMFWGAFTWDKKGPCHIWQKETAAEKSAAKDWIDEENERLEPILRAEWGSVNPMRRLRVDKRNSGKKPQWKWNADHGKLGRNSVGIDWYRYRTVILEKKLIPFYKDCLDLRPRTIIQEDNAGAHAHPSQPTTDVYPEDQPYVLACKFT
jgi:hypothetical protein